MFLCLIGCGFCCLMHSIPPFSSFLKALMFCQSGQYINTARIDPALLYVENLRLRIKDKKSLAVCIMTGTLTESYLVASSEAGPRHSPYPIHKVTIAPLEQEMRRDASVWGLLFDFRVITGMMSPAGFGFGTRGEGKGDGPGYSNCKWYNSSRIVLIFFCSICPIVACKIKDLEDCNVVASVVDSRLFLFAFPILQ